MTELTRSLLTAARDGLAPDPAIAARVRAKVAAAVGAPGPAPAAAATARGALIVKLGAVLVVAAAITGIALRSEATLDAPRVTAVAPHEELDQPAAAMPAKEAAATPQPVSAQPHARAKQEPASLSREVELIDQAMVSLRARDPRAALAALHTFDRETLGHAQMAEEAAAIGIEAHCTLHEDVGERLAAFDRMWPSSAQRTRITTACSSR